MLALSNRMPHSWRSWALSGLESRWTKLYARTSNLSWITTDASRASTTDRSPSLTHWSQRQYSKRPVNRQAATLDPESSHRHPMKSLVALSIKMKDHTRIGIRLEEIIYGKASQTPGFSPFSARKRVTGSKSKDQLVNSSQWFQPRQRKRRTRSCSWTIQMTFM